MTAVAAAAAAPPAQQWKAAVALFTAGEIAVLRVTKPPFALALLVQALTATPSPAQRPGGINAAAATQAAVGNGMTHGTQVQGEPAGAAEGQVDLAAYAWVALGKLCMADEGLAKRAAPLFVQVREGTSVCIVERTSAGVPVCLDGLCG
jgi:hypothetical protein